MIDEGVKARAFGQRCGDAGIAGPVPEGGPGRDGLRPELAHLLTEGGITSVLLTRPDQALERACIAARIQVLPLSRSSFGGLAEVSRAGPVEPVVFTGGLTPGVTD